MNRVAGEPTCSNRDPLDLIERDKLGEHWGERLPEGADALFAWCIAQSQDTLLSLLAYLSALTVNAVENGRQARSGDDPAEHWRATLALDMRQWAPTPEGFYERLPKATLAEAVREAKVPPLGVSLVNVKKTEAARLAARALAGTGWLPEPLRPALSVAA